MVHKQTIVNNYVAVIFLVLLVTVNLTSANPLSSTDSPTKKPVVDYNVQISEDEEQYNETIEVDTEKQTELFKVPAHNNVDQSNILHDFKTNTSLLMLPEKKICYLLPLSEELPSPTELEGDLDQPEGNNTEQTKIIDSKWIVDSEMTDRSVLSEELANFCPQYPIYQVKIMEDSLTSTRIQPKETKHRKRRSLRYPPIHPCDLCAGGKSTVSYNDICWCNNIGGYWFKRCKVQSRTCYKIRVCYRWFWRRICYTRHFTNTVYCYQYECKRRTYGWSSNRFDRNEV